MAQTKSPTKRTPPKAYMRWPHLIRKNILEMVLDIHSITPIRHDLPEFDQLSKFIREDDQGIQILDGESPVIADLTERFARAVQNSPFQYTWQPNHGPNRGERLWNNYEHTRPKLAASLMTHARALRATESFEGRMWRFVNGYSPMYGSKIPEIASQFHLSQEEVKQAYADGRNAPYIDR